MKIPQDLLANFPSRTYKCPMCGNDLEPVKVNIFNYYQCKEKSCKRIFNPAVIRAGSSKRILVLGTTHCGKTTYLSSLIYQLALNQTTSQYIETEFSIVDYGIDPEFESLRAWIARYSAEKSKPFLINGDTTPTIPLVNAISEMIHVPGYPTSTVKPDIDIEGFQRRHKQTFILKNRRSRKYLSINFIDLPGEMFEKAIEEHLLNDNEEFQSFVSEIFSADGILFLIDPFSIDGIMTKFKKAGIELENEGDYSATIDTIITNMSHTFDMVDGPGPVWTFGVTKIDALEAQLGDVLGGKKAFDPDSLLKRYVEGRYDEDFYKELINYEEFLDRAERFKDRYENILNPLIANLKESFDLNYDPTISPIVSYVKPDSHNKGIIPSINVVEPLIYLLKKLNFIKL